MGQRTDKATESLGCQILYSPGTNTDYLGILEQQSAETDLKLSKPTSS